MMVGLTKATSTSEVLRLLWGEVELLILFHNNNRINTSRLIGNVTIW